MLPPAFAIPGSLAIGAAAVLYVLQKLIESLKRSPRNPGRLPYPPGPRPRPVLGNVTEIPRDFPWLKYMEWGREYGPLRANIYSDRPNLPAVPLMGWELNFAFMEYSPRWRKHRRLMHRFFKKDMTLQYRPIHTTKVHEMLRNLLATPHEFMAHARMAPGAAILKTVYGYDVQSGYDLFVELAEDRVARLGEGIFSFINAAPWIRFIPGSSFRRFISESRAVMRQIYDTPYEWAKANIQQGTDSTSMVARLQEIVQEETGEADIPMEKALAALAYTAGADTTTTALTTFFLAMALNPEVQKQAQAQIDAVIGPNRLPDFLDREQLPYVEAIYRGGSALATACSAGGGATVFVNIWAMSFDESGFSEPYKFKPERFINVDGNLTSDSRMDIAAFGHGRRICPGIYFAEDLVWLAIASLLCAFNIKPKEGVDIPESYHGKFILHPDPFECEISPRSADARALIEATLDGSEH
ncbi:O-methylsterigmatocystin oxidoreductase [Mycena kentingensis (nom. inval.)]|nr:O-methylsterigmatocystin oxidoreductase [Mycena kentingensis (nom. inval.)]